MDGKGWKPEYGISREGLQLLGYLEALPQEERAGILASVAQFCRKEGYLSLYDDLRKTIKRETPACPERLAKVLPFRR